MQSSKYSHTRITSMTIQSSQSRRPCHYSQPTQNSKYNLSRVMVRGGVALTITSSKSKPPSQANHSSQSSKPSRNFRSSQYSIPGDACNTWKTIQPSVSRQSSRSRKSRKPSHSCRHIHHFQYNQSRFRVRAA